MDKFTLENFNLTYSDGVHALQNITMQVPAQSITVLFGPAAGGKSSLLRTLNRLNDLADVQSTSGSVVMYGNNGEAGSTSTAFNLLDTRLDVINLRRRVAMVFARPIVLPLTIRQNLTYGLEVAGERDKSRLEAAIERSLKQAALWDEVADRLDNPATALSGGQQQRLCLARSLALEPDVILLDEPTSGLDPLSTAKVEASLQELKSTYTIILVPHSIQQAARMADQAGFFLQGELIEFSPGKEIFITPRLQKTQDYVEGRFG